MKIDVIFWKQVKTKWSKANNVTYASEEDYKDHMADDDLIDEMNDLNLLGGD